VGVWLLRLPTRSVFENASLAVGLGSAVWCLTLSALSWVGGLSVPLVDLLTLGCAAIGVWGVALCWLRARIASRTATYASAVETPWPITGRPVAVLGALVAVAGLMQALAPPLPGNEFAAEVLRSAASVYSGAPSSVAPSELMLAAPLVLGGPGACSVLRWGIVFSAAAAAALTVELPGPVGRSAGHLRSIAAALVVASPIASAADDAASGVLIGTWLALAWLAWRRSLGEPTGQRWRLLAMVLAGPGLLSVAVTMHRAPPAAGMPVGEMFRALGPLLASAAPLSLLVRGVERSATAIFGLAMLALGAARGVGLESAAWATPLLAASAAQAVIALDGFRLPVRRWATAALAAALAVQAALPLVNAKKVWRVALGREDRDRFLSAHIAEFRAVRLLDALARRNSLVYSDQDELLYYEGPRLQSRAPAEQWARDELNQPVYLLHVEPPRGPAHAQRWLKARGLSIEDPAFASILDYEYFDGDDQRRRYRLVRLAPESAQVLAASASAATSVADERGADESVKHR
jgi:hypothetical protein